MSPQHTSNYNRVLVLWADEKSPNLGVRVLAEGAAAMAVSAWGPDTKVVAQDFAGTQTGVPMGAKALLREFFSGKRSIRNFLATFDVVLDTGAGDSFTDIYGFKRLLTMLVVQRIAISIGKPVILLPQTIGPFQTKRGRFLAKRNLNRYCLLMSRDPASTEVALELGRRPEVTASDMVFALPGQELSKKYDVLLNISGLLWNDNDHVDHMRYRQQTLEVLRLVQGMGRKVTLLAHVVDGAPNDDDCRAIRALNAELGSELPSLIPETLLDARLAIAQADLIIGARMHACLNALSLGVPAIPWAYSRKFAPLMLDLGWEHVVDLSKPNPADATIEILNLVSTEALRVGAKDVAVTGHGNLHKTVSALQAVEGRS